MKTNLVSVRALFQRFGVVFWCCCLAVLARGAVWHVSPGHEGGDGRGWSSALGSLDRALELASPGDSIWLRGGVYEPAVMREVEGETAFASSFVLKDGVAIYGGFRGDESSVDQRRLRNDGTYGWEFAYETVLRQGAGQSGCVVRGPDAGLEEGCELNGLVIAGGQALGAYEEGYGGGVYGSGRLRMVSCLLRHNVARQGGGIFWTGPLEMMCCGLFDNDLVAEGWSGVGGGGMVLGDGFRLTGVICTGNGVLRQGVQSGGGLYLSGNGVAAHCTVVGNRTSRNGSGVWLAQGARLVNSLVWGNEGRLSQVVLSGGSTSTCGIEGWSQEGAGDVPLLSDNCGVGGIELNDNWVDGYYPCFLSVDRRDFRLGGGSYALNRGGDLVEGLDAQGVPLADSFPPDLGACGSTQKGNLAIDFSVEHPHVYGGESQILVYYGMGTPGGLECFFWTDQAGALLAEGNSGEWTASWQRKGPLDLWLQGDVRGGEEEHWHGVTLTKMLDIRPRPLVVAATDLEYRHGDGQPELEWMLAGGRLMPGDQLVGDLSCAYDGMLGKVIPILRGSLRVEDGNGGENYRLTFLDGEMIYSKGLAEFTVRGEQATYDGKPLELTVTTIPENLPHTVIYEGTGETDYGPTATPPTQAGTYVAHIDITDDEYEGTHDVSVHIGKAELRVIAEDKSRKYGEDNPVLTMICEGFMGNDDMTDITMPAIGTEATPRSPVRPEGYPIRLQGGSSQNYALVLVDGCLRVSPGSPQVGEVTVTTPLEYGDCLGDAVLAREGEGIPGTLSWGDPNLRPQAGMTTQDWIFTPDDQVNWETVTGQVGLMVARRPLTLAIADCQMTYGDEVPVFQTSVQAGSVLAGDRVEGAPVCLNVGAVGEYVIQSGTLSAGKNYELTVLEGTLSVVPRPVTLQAQDVSKGFGEPDPQLSWKVTQGSFVQGDRPTGSLSREQGEKVGSYRIVQGSLELSGNYALSFEPGQLSIHALMPVLGPSGLAASELTYGQNLGSSRLQGKVQHPSLGYDIPGVFHWVSSEVFPEVGVSRHPWRFVPAPDTGMKALEGECEVHVRKASLTVRIADEDLSRPYLESNPPFRLVYAGFVRGEGPEDLLSEPVATTDARGDSPVGRYAVRLSGGLSDNYEFIYESSELGVVPASPVASGPVRLRELVYGEPCESSLLEGHFSRASGGEEIGGRLELLDLPPGGRLSAGVHELGWQFTPADGNFGSVRGTVSVTVRRAPLVVTAEDLVLKVDDPLPDFFPYRLEGLVAGDHEDSPGVFTEPIMVRCTLSTTSRSGEGELILSGGVSLNYDVTLVHGHVVVERLVPAPWNLDSLTLYYGDELSETPTWSGYIFDFSILPTQRMLFCYTSNTICVYHNAYNYFHHISTNYELGKFVNPRSLDDEDVSKLGIQGTIYWDWPAGIRPVGEYPNVGWHFVPSGPDALRYTEARGTATVHIEPKVVEIYGPRLEYVWGNQPGEELSHNTNWTYRESDVVDGQTGSGYLMCSVVCEEGFDAQNVSNYRKWYSWDTSNIDFGPNYRPLCRRDVHGVAGLPRILEIQVEDRLGGFNKEKVPVRLVNGVDTSTDDWSVTVLPGNYSIGNKYLYMLAPDGGPPPSCVQYRFAGGSYPRHTYFLQSGPVVDVVSREIFYGDPIPEPEFAVKFSDSLTHADVMGQLAYETLPREPGHYPISPENLKLVEPSRQAHFLAGRLTIKRRPITISTGKLVKHEGEPDPEPTYRIVKGSLMPGDELSGALIRREGEETGLYKYELGTVEHPYYDITVSEDSVLEIISERNHQYDWRGLKAYVQHGAELATAEFRGQIVSVQTGDVVPGSIRILRDGAKLPCGISREDALFVPDDLSQHQVAYMIFEVHVLPEQVVVTPDSHRIQWGDPLPLLTYELEGEVHKASLSGQLEAVPQDEWSYAIGAGDISAGAGYSVEVPSGSMIHVMRRRLVLEAVNARKEVGSPDPTFQYRIVSGSLAPGDELVGVRLGRVAGEAVGAYEITVSVQGTVKDPDLSHYELELLPGVLEIAEAATSAGPAQRGKVLVQGQVGEEVASGSIVSWGGSDYVYGVNCFRTLEAALAAVSSGGVVLVAPGVYESPTGEWFLDKGISLIGDDCGDVDSEIILLGTLVAPDDRVTKLLLSNLSVVSPLDRNPAVHLGDGVGNVVTVNCRLIGDTVALQLGSYGQSASIIYSEIMATDVCIQGELRAGQGAPATPLVLVCNSFEGREALRAEGFSVISSSNLLNGAGTENIGN